MAELGKNAYIKQMIIYFGNQDYQVAYTFGKEFAQKFPDEMVAHFFLAKAAYWTGNHQEAASEGRKAFNLSTVPEDMLATAIIAGTAYYELREYSKGLEMLNGISKNKTSEELETLLFLFNLAIKDEKAALVHVEKLYKMNKKTAEDLMLKVIGGK